MFHKVANIRVTLYFHFLEAGFNHFLFPKWVLKKVMLRNYKDRLEEVSEVERGAKEIESVVEICKHFAFAI